LLTRRSVSRGARPDSPGAVGHRFRYRPGLGVGWRARPRDVAHGTVEITRSPGGLRLAGVFPVGLQRLRRACRLSVVAGC